MRQLASPSRTCRAARKCTSLPPLSETMSFYAKQSVFAGDLVIYFDNTGIRVFPVPEATFPTMEWPAVVNHESTHAYSDVATQFASLTLAPFNIDNPNIWKDDCIDVSFPDWWNYEFGIPFVIHVFNEASSGADSGITVTRYRLDIEGNPSNPAQAPSYMLSVVDTFTLKNGPITATSLLPTWTSMRSIRSGAGLSWRKLTHPTST